MKKIIALLLIGILALSLFACGNAEKPVANTDAATASVDIASIRANLDKAVEYINSVADTKAMNVQLQTDDPQNLYYTWSYEAETVNDDIVMDIKLDNETITMGKTTYTDLKNMGYTIQSEFESVEPNYSMGFSIIKDNKSSNLTISNNTDKALPSADLPVNEIQCADFQSTMSFDYKGLTIGSSLEDTIKTLGTPHNNISLSADSMDTYFDLNYFSETKNGDLTTNDNLSLHFLYDTEANKATLTSLRLSRDIFNVPAEEETK